MKLRLLIKGIFVAFFVFYLTPLIAQTENKTVVITVSGSGKTQEEAKQNALRNAIEQAFGTFISSNTQILNDELVKDEIVSVSSGNIQEYSVLSEVQAPDGYWSNTVQAKVSIDKLTKFCESKGVSVEFKGSLFALNIKQQELNKSNEEKVIEDMCSVLKNISENIFDYEITVGEPTAKTERIKISDDPDDWRTKTVNGWGLPITIFAIPNNNLQLLADYFIKTVKSLSLNESEISDLSKLSLETYSIILESSTVQTLSNSKPDKKKKKSEQVENTNTILNTSELITLRNKKSMEYIADFLLYFRKGLLNFQITTDLGSKLGNDFVSYDDSKNPSWYTNLSAKDFGFKPLFSRNDKNYSVITLDYYGTNREGITYSGTILNPYLEYNHVYFGKPHFITDVIYTATPYERTEYPISVSFTNMPIGKKVIELKYNDFKTTDELSKISGYKISYCKNKLIREVTYDYNYKVSFKVVKE